MDFLPAAPSARELRVVLLLTGATALYVVYHYFLARDSFARRFRERGTDPETAHAWSVLAQRISGGLLLGIGGLGLFLVAGGPDPGLWSVHTPASIGAAALVGLVVLPVTLTSARKPDLYSQHPEIRTPQFHRGWIVRSAAAWALYLAGYEYFFRGLLVFSLADLLGAWPALAVTTCFYTLAHLPKSAPETIGCLLMGYVFGLLALLGGSFVAPFLLHLAIATGTENMAAQSNPDMRWGGPP